MWNRISKSIFLNLFLFAVAFAVSRSAARMIMQAVNVKNEARSIDAKITGLKQEKAALDRVIAELNTPHAAEREAKERRNLKRPGEKVAVIISESAKEKKEEIKETWWQSLKKRVFR